MLRDVEHVSLQQLARSELIRPSPLPPRLRIRLTAHNCYTNVPKPQAIKYRGLEKLQDMLVHFNQVADIIYYEVLDLPLRESSKYQV